MDFGAVLRFDKMGNCFPVGDGSTLFDARHNNKIIWKNGDTTVEKDLRFYERFGVVGNAFYFQQDFKQDVQKAELINGKIETSVTLTGCFVSVLSFKFGSLHYFIQRPEYPDATFAVPIDKNHRDTKGIQFNVDFDEVEGSNSVVVHNNTLFIYKKEDGLTTVTKYPAESVHVLEKKGLPVLSWQRLWGYGDHLFYLTDDSDLVAVATDDLSFEVIKTNLPDRSQIVSISESGLMQAQTSPTGCPVRIYAGEMPKKYKL